MRVWAQKKAPQAEACGVKITINLSHYEIANFTAGLMVSRPS